MGKSAGPACPPAFPAPFLPAPSTSALPTRRRLPGYRPLGVEVTLANLSADRATILPIESALGYSVSQHLFLGSGQHLTLEGSSDFIYLLRMTEHNTTKELPGLDPRLAMIPVGGADNMPAFVALLGGG
jgi:hypothetical protein